MTHQGVLFLLRVFGSIQELLNLKTQYDQEHFSLRLSEIWETCEKFGRYPKKYHGREGEGNNYQFLYRLRKRSGFPDFLSGENRAILDKIDKLKKEKETPVQRLNRLIDQGIRPSTKSNNQQELNDAHWVNKLKRRRDEQEPEVQQLLLQVEKLKSRPKRKRDDKNKRKRKRRRRNCNLLIFETSEFTYTEMNSSFETLSQNRIQLVNNS